MSVLVDEGQSVKVGQPLLLLDSVAEDKQQQRIEKMQKLRSLAASEYQDDSAKTSREILQFAVDIATYAVKKQWLLDKEAEGFAEIHLKSGVDAAVQHTAYQGALSQQSKAEANLKKYDLSLKRFLDMNAAVQAYFQYELTQIELDRKRLTVLAPIAGIVTLRVAKNSFIESGRTLLLIQNPPPGNPDAH